MDTPTVQIPQFSYNVKLPDIGEGYAKGIETAGKGIAAGLHDVLDVATQNRNADDTLQAMNKAKILSDDAYQAVAGKSLGAKQTMLGLYAGQWVAQQAQARAMQQQGYGANLDVWKAHQALLDEISKLQATRPQTLPMNVQNRQPQTPAPQAQPNQPVAPQQGLPIGRQNLTVSGIPGVASPLGSGNITNPIAAQPQYNVGKPFNPSDPIPSGARPGTAGGKRGYLVPDATAPGGYSFRPIS